MTPWLVTGVTGSVAMLEALLPAKPDLTIENRYGGVSLVPACEAGHVAYVKRVLRTGEDVNHVTNQGLTCLLEAVMLGDGGPEHQQIVAYILAHGADRTIRDPHAGPHVSLRQRREPRLAVFSAGFRRTSLLSALTSKTSIARTRSLNLAYP